MIPQAILIKYGIVAAFLVAIFTGGCQVQKRMDAAKIIRLETNYDRCVSIVDVFQDNVDELSKSLDEQNTAIEDLGKESERKKADLEAWYRDALRRYDATNNEIIREARDEAAELRERLSKLSVCDACNQAWVELTR
jgi:uncharacterized protein YydD (DUF2326 family)